jgi:hypothetical protein
MAKHKPRIIIKDLPKDMLISEAEKKKIIGGSIISYMNAGSMNIDYVNLGFRPIYANAIGLLPKIPPPGK